MPAAGTWRGALLAGLLVPAAAAADPVAAPELEGLPIARLEFVVLDLYDPLPTGRLRPIYALANRLHINTRTQTVRRHMLLEPGDPYREALARESERALRALDILQPERIEPIRRGDSVVVRVTTRDSWSTSPEFNLETGGGEVFGSVALVESNLLGTGKRIALEYREDPVGISRSARLRDPALLGSRHQFDVSGFTGADGSGHAVEVSLPFFAENAATSYGIGWSRAPSVVRLYQRARPVADFARRQELVEIFFGRGRKPHEVVRRWTAGLEMDDRRFGSSRLEPEAPPEFAGGEEELRLRRAFGTLRWWRPRFVQHSGINRLDGIEDFDLGWSARLRAGVAHRALGSTANEGLLRAELEGGAGRGDRYFALARLDLSSRLRREPRETIARAELHAVSHPHPDRALVLSVEGASGHHVLRDFQIVLGGLNGLRAYPVQAIAGREAFRGSLEHRWRLARDVLQLVSIGTAVFYDAGRTWGPGSAGAGWHHDAGVGLMLSLPRSGTARVARFDVAWPLSPERDGRRDPVLFIGSNQAF